MMMKFPLLFSTLAAFVIAPWLVLAPPASSAPPECPCFPADTLLSEVTELFAPSEISFCSTHPFATDLQSVAGIDAAGMGVIVQVVIPHDLNASSGFCVVREPLAPRSVFITAASDAWTCVRQITATCRALGF